MSKCTFSRSAGSETYRHGFIQLYREEIGKNTSETYQCILWSVKVRYDPVFEVFEVEGTHQRSMSCATSITLSFIYKNGVTRARCMTGLTARPTLPYPVLYSQRLKSTDHSHVLVSTRIDHACQINKRPE